MHMIPKARPARRFIDLPDGPELLAAGSCDAGTSPDEIKKRVLTWASAIARPVRDAAPALEAIAWAKGMPSLLNVLGSEDCLALGGLLSSLSDEVDERLLRDQPLVHQLLAGELSLTLATRLIRGVFASRLEKSGRAAISLGLNQILDRQGMLAAENLHLLRPLLACWTRCRAMAAELPGGGLGTRPEQRYLRFVRNSLRCNRPDGRPLFAENELAAWNCGAGNTESWGRELFDAVLKSGVDDTDRQLAAIALPKLSPGVVGRPPKKSAGLPPPSLCFEAGAVAIMRRGWNRDDERLAVLFSGRACELELVSSGRVAVSGAWAFEVRQNGQPLEPVTNWESSCWYSDAEIDYLELEIELTGGVRLERQMVLARDDRFVILADAVLSPQLGDLEYRGVLPLAAGVEFRGADESREGLLEEGRAAITGRKSGRTARPLAHVLPLGMPEWRAEKCGGELRAIPEGLELCHKVGRTSGSFRQEVDGPGGPSYKGNDGHGRSSYPSEQVPVRQALLAPLFIDLDRRRFRRRMTWRRLTVAEGLAAVGPEKALGFRVAIGSEQWLFYRSLAAPGNRTVLGHNLSTESLIGRFGKGGKVTSIVEIE